MIILHELKKHGGKSCPSYGLLREYTAVLRRLPAVFLHLPFHLAPRASLTMVKTYILAPNWTTAPPPNGPIQLGHILDDLTEFVPLNRRSVPEIPEDDKNPADIKTGFTTSRSELLSGELGVFARIFGLVGIGAGAGVFYEKNKSDVLICKRLDTTTFDPTPEYIEKSVKVPEVSHYMKLRRYKDPVYSEL